MSGVSVWPKKKKLVAVLTIAQNGYTLEPCRASLSHTCCRLGVQTCAAHVTELNGSSSSTSTRDSNTISIWNNGKGIPVVEHKDEKMYVPALIFGHLLTSSNYDDDEKKVTGERISMNVSGSTGYDCWNDRQPPALTLCLVLGGRNGYGAKLCNIFSTKFTVETACKEYRHSFKQVSRFTHSNPMCQITRSLSMWVKTSCFYRTSPKSHVPHLCEWPNPCIWVTCVWVTSIWESIGVDAHWCLGGIQHRWRNKGAKNISLCNWLLPPQTWQNNMSKTSEPKVKFFDGEDFTCVTFQPDLAKFKMEKLDKDIVALLTRRAYDVAGSCRGVKVSLNGKKLPVSLPLLFFTWLLLSSATVSGNYQVTASHLVRPITWNALGWLLQQVRGKW